MPVTIDISIHDQTLTLNKHQRPLKTYPVSTAANGPGEQNGSYCTPTGKHLVRAKIGAGAPPNTAFIGRRNHGEIYTADLAIKQPDRDWILSRILWLSGLETGFNRSGNVDTMRRYIYIHGSPHALNHPNSHGCVRMDSHDVIELFNLTPPYTPVTIYA